MAVDLCHCAWRRERIGLAAESVIVFLLLVVDTE